MLMLRLQRIGKAKQPTYRLIVSEKARDTQAGSLEILGNYNPVNKEKKLELKIDRVKYWLSVGAQPSNTVHNLLLKNGVIAEGKKKRSVFLSQARKKKIEEIKKKSEAPKT
ncbi:MAG: 30S ribosomal protein S16 [Candidatus Magasanikbacteria bacterium]|nr:30S ribosomal protein S16 [Candidatus Magasanikbacteria bacterium]